MNLYEQSSIILLLTLLFSLLMATAILAWGRRLARQGDWLLAISFVVSALGVALSFASLQDQAGHVRLWIRGWILPRSEVGSISIGVIEDSLGLAMVAISIVVASILAANRAYLSQEPRAERIYAGLGFSVMGVSLAWLASTPLMACIGMLAVIFGGFVALGSRWDGDVESEVGSRFVWERTIGIILTVIGALGLAAGRAGLAWDELEKATSFHSSADKIGAAILLTGLFLQIQPFPLLGALVKPTNVPTLVRAIQAQLFPSWAAMALLFRFEPQLRAMGVLETFGAIQLFAAALALGMGYAQQNWRTSFGAWLSGGSSVCAAILALSGSIHGITAWIGFLLGAVVISFSASTIAMGGDDEKSQSTRATWTKVCAFLGIASATGMAGFVSAGSVVHSITALWEQPGEWVPVLSVFFLFNLLGWRLVWSLGRSNNTVRLPWTTVLSPLLLVILALGIWWTGALTGGIIPGRPDQFLHPAVVSFFPGARLSIGDEPQFAAASGAYWGAFVIALALAYFWAAKGTLKPKSAAVTKALAFVSEGYKVDLAASRGIYGLRLLGEKTEKFLDRSVWSKWLPEVFVRGIRGLSQGAILVDRALTGRFDLAVQSSVEVPAKVLQLLQNGNVQWYLFFSLSAGLAILIHFLRS